MEEELIRLGLAPNEAKVYTALLDRGSATVSEIAQKAGINRTTVYDVVSRLGEMGLVTKAAATKKQRYAAEAPEKLPLVLQRRAEHALEQAHDAERLVAKLKLLTKSHGAKPQVKLFEGASGIKSLYDQTLLSQEPIRSFSSTASLEGFDPEYLHAYYRRRAAKRVFIKAIINDQPSAHEYQSQDKRLFRELRIVPKEMMDIVPEVYVYDNNLAIFSLKEKLAVLIESPDIANALKKLYDLAWSKAGEHNKVLKRKKTFRHS